MVDTNKLTGEQLEEWFLGAIYTEPLPFQEIIDVLAGLYASSSAALADSWSELLQDVLRKKHDVPAMLSLMELRAGWKDDDPEFRSLCHDSILGTYAQAHVGSAFVDSVGFDKPDVSTFESLRRLRLLLQLAPGLICMDKTWGFGIVNNIDVFYKKVLIDFEKKPGHGLSFEYAAQVLSLLNDSHILVMKHKDPENLRQLVKSNPAEVVRILLRSYGPLNVPTIQELLARGIVSEAEWKPFWDSARKVLKADKRLKFPSSRLDLIRLLEEDRAYDDRWFEKLGEERHLETLMAQMKELADATEPASLSDRARQVLSDRVLHMLKGANSKQLYLVAQTLIMAGALDVSIDPAVRAQYVNLLLARAGLLQAAADLPVSGLEPLLEYLLEYDRQRASSLLLAVLPDVTLTTLNTMVDFLCSRGFEKETMDVFRSYMAAGKANIEMISWLSKRLDLLQSRSLGTVADLLTQSITRLQEPLHGERLKAGKLLRATFERKEWLEVALGGMLPGQRQRFVMMLKDSTGWPVLERNAVLARVIGLYPELHRLLLSDDDSSKPGRSIGRYSSWRSYTERRKKLEKIIDVDLPENGKDLALARSYGDLSENHAFKAAKERQAMLVNQRDTLANELKEVKGTSFEGFASETASTGTRVLFQRAGGTTEERFILGEWDTDEQLGILSCKTTLAAALAGHKKGDQVDIPGSAGTEKCLIIEIGPLPPHIIAWAKGTEANS